MKTFSFHYQLPSIITTSYSTRSRKDTPGTGDGCTEPCPHPGHCPAEPARGPSGVHTGRLKADGLQGARLPHSDLAAPRGCLASPLCLPPLLVNEKNWSGQPPWDSHTAHMTGRPGCLPSARGTPSLPHLCPGQSRRTQVRNWCRRVAKSLHDTLGSHPRKNVKCSTYFQSMCKDIFLCCGLYIQWNIIWS